MAVLACAAHATEVAPELQRRMAPSGAFSVMVPTDWHVASGLNFSASSTKADASLNGTAYRIQRRPPLREFSDARYLGVTKMGIYKQVGAERPLASDGGVVREYEGRWPGDKFITYYVVACKSAEEIYACVALTMAKEEFSLNRGIYEEMLSSLVIHP